MQFSIMLGLLLATCVFSPFRIVVISGEWIGFAKIIQDIVEGHGDLDHYLRLTELTFDKFRNWNTKLEDVYIVEWKFTVEGVISRW